jgi:hypothetical protein
MDLVSTCKVVGSQVHACQACEFGKNWGSILKRFAFVAVILVSGGHYFIGSTAHAEDQPGQLTFPCSCADGDLGKPLSIEPRKGESEEDLRDRFATKCDATCNRQVLPARKEWSPAGTKGDRS